MKLTVNTTNPSVYPVYRLTEGIKMYDYICRQENIIEIQLDPKKTCE